MAKIPLSGKSFILQTNFPMAFLDIILALVLGYGLIRGIFNGFFMEFASLISLVAGIFIAVKFSAALANVLASKLSWDPVAVRLVAFILLALAVIIAVALLARLFTSLASFAGIGILNRILGGIFGMMKFALIGGTMLALMERYELPSQETRDKSLLYAPVAAFGSLLYPSLVNWMPTLKDSVTT